MMPASVPFSPRPLWSRWSRLSLRPLLRALLRLHHRMHVKDLDFAIASHERMLLGLPAEIRALQELRRYHQGRAATLASDRNPVSYSLGSCRGVRPLTDTERESLMRRTEKRPSAGPVAQVTEINRKRPQKRKA